SAARRYWSHAGSRRWQRDRSWEARCFSDGRERAPGQAPFRDSDIGVLLHFGLAAGMGHRAVMGIAHGLGIFPQRAGLVFGFTGLPLLPAAGEFGGAHIDAENTLHRIDGDDVAILDQANGAADRCFRPDMADAEAARGAGETPVSDQRHLFAHALAVDRRGGGEHLAHAGTALRALVADDDDVAFLVLAGLHGGEGRLLAIEHPRRADMLQPRHACDFHDGAARREIALQADDAAGRRDRIGDRPHDILVLRELHALQVLLNGLASHRQAVAMDVAAPEQLLQNHLHAADLVEVLGDVAPAGLEVGDVGRRLEDLRHIVEIELYAG